MPSLGSYHFPNLSICRVPNSKVYHAQGLAKMSNTWTKSNACPTHGLNRMHVQHMDQDDKYPTHGLIIRYAQHMDYEQRSVIVTSICGKIYIS